LSVAVQAKLKQDVLWQKARTPERRCWPLRLRTQGYLPNSEAVACREFVVESKQHRARVLPPNCRDRVLSA